MKLALAILLFVFGLTQGFWFPNELASVILSGACGYYAGGMFFNALFNKEQS